MNLKHAWQPKRKAIGEKLSETSATVPGQVMPTKQIAQMFLSGQIEPGEGNYHEGEDEDMIASTSFDWTNYITPYQKNILSKKNPPQAEAPGEAKTPIKEDATEEPNNDDGGGSIAETK